MARSIINSLQVFGQLISVQSLDNGCYLDLIDSSYSEDKPTNIRVFAAGQDMAASFQPLLSYPLLIQAELHSYQVATSKSGNEIHSPLLVYRNAIILPQDTQPLGGLSKGVISGVISYLGDTEETKTGKHKRSFGLIHSQWNGADTEESIYRVNFDLWDKNPGGSGQASKCIFQKGGTVVVEYSPRFEEWTSQDGEVKSTTKFTLISYVYSSRSSGNSVVAAPKLQKFPVGATPKVILPNKGGSTNCAPTVEAQSTAESTALEPPF